MNDTIGIDVSKDTLDVHRLSDGKHIRFRNNGPGLRDLGRWVGRQAVRIVYEATGRYHRELERTLGSAGHGLVKVNPRRARRFAEATGQDAKTDRVDAALLARMGLVLDLEATPPPTESMNQIRELQVARVGLIKDRTACRNRIQAAHNRIVLTQLRARQRQVDRQIVQIDAELRRLATGDPALARRLDILLSIPGIGPAAVALIADMPELGSMSGKEAASLAGLAPITRQSGTWKGKAKIGGGRATLRAMLYMPALVATRFNPQLGLSYQTLRQAGKPAKVAITAVMRKLLIIANALLRDGRKWAPHPA